MKTASKSAMYQYNVHSILSIQSDSFHYIPEYFFAPNDKDTNPDLVLSTHLDDTALDIRQFVQIAPGLFYCGDTDSVISTFRPLGFKFGWQLTGLTSNPTVISISRHYETLSKRVLKMPVSMVFSADHYVKLILQVKLLLKRHVFLLGGCFVPHNSDEGVIISAFGGMGKTTTVLGLLKQLGGHFVADDTIIIDGEEAYAYPQPIRLRKHGSVLLSREKYVSPTQVLAPDTITKRVKVKALYLLEGGRKNEIMSIASNAAANKLLTINRKSLPYYMERSVLGYSYFDSAFDLQGIMTLEENLIRTFVRNMKCYVVRSNREDSHTYTEMVADMLEKGA